MNPTSRIDQFDGLRPWLEGRIGYSLDQAAQGSTAVLPNREDPELPLLAFRFEESAMMAARPSWLEPLRSVVDTLTQDELFAVFGAYELARVTLADDIAIWGPSWYYFGAQEHFRPSSTESVAQLSAVEVETMADASIFWHCHWHQAAACFGIPINGELVALATVNDRGGSVYEIEVDVAPANGLSGLGRAVVSAAGRWILQQGGLILATTAPWNIPSARLLRSVGLRYVLCDMVGQRGPFRVPPQPLGKPRPDTNLQNHYPDWAINQQIQPR